ncbi:MAG: T9SS type A sorting domain-containing protein [Bacteroidota bacterium]|nr:MAG: T9SS type A sorting domain-containing protein [Bacteroidota bacterium]
MITDSLNPYPVSNYSAFAIHLPQNIGLNWGNYNYYFRFWHRFETDSLKDGCWLEFSSDTGHTWFRTDTISWGWPLNSFSNGWTACNLYNNDLTSTSMDTLLDGRMAWSIQWRVAIYCLVVEYGYAGKTRKKWSHKCRAVCFKSDTLPESKSGWTIQELKFGYVNVSGIDELQSANQLPVYPNPSLNGKFYFDVPQQLPTTINVYTALGTKVYQNTGQQL